MPGRHRLGGIAKIDMVHSARERRRQLPPGEACFGLFRIGEPACARTPSRGSSWNRRSRLIRLDTRIWGANGSDGSDTAMKDNRVDDCILADHKLIQRLGRILQLHVLQLGCSGVFLVLNTACLLRTRNGVPSSGYYCCSRSGRRRAEGQSASP